MKIFANQIFYQKDGAQNQTNTNTNTERKKVQLTDYRDVLTAINKGKLTVDGVTLELSEEVRESIKAANEQRFKDAEKLNEYNAAVHNANVAKQQGDAMKDFAKNQAKAIEIARRISSGGQVPYQDEKLLMDFSPEMYQMAKQAGMLAKEHEKYDTLVEDEEGKTKEYDVDAGKIDAKYQVEVEVSLGETPSVESVAEVAVE